MKSNIYIDDFDISYWKYWKQMEIYLILEFSVETVGIQWIYQLYWYFEKDHKKKEIYLVFILFIDNVENKWKYRWL